MNKSGVSWSTVIAAIALFISGVSLYWSCETRSEDQELVAAQQTTALLIKILETRQIYSELQEINEEILKTLYEVEELGDDELAKVSHRVKKNQSHLMILVHESMVNAEEMYDVFVASGPSLSPTKLESLKPRVEAMLMRARKLRKNAQETLEVSLSNVEKQKRLKDLMASD